MNIPLKSAPLENQELPARMALTQPGQITWADLNCKSNCIKCAHYRDAGKKQGKDKGKGRCFLVKVHTKKPGALFRGTSAWACPKFEALNA